MIIGTLFFIGMFLAIKERQLTKEQLSIKICIGTISLCASIYTFLFSLFNSHENHDFIRFLDEAISIFPIYQKLSLVLSITTLFLLIITYSLKKIDLSYITFITLTYVCILNVMINNLDIYLNPIMDGHARSINCYVDCILVFGYLFLKYFKISENKDYTKYYIPVVCCGISLTFWQIVNSYYFDVNIKYLKNALNNCNRVLFIPEDYEEISSFHNKNLRRYIWHSIYSATALAVADDYKIKTMPLHYTNPQTSGNKPFRENLYAIIQDNIVCLPYFVCVATKNKFWDITDYAIALNKYNEDNNIKTAKKQ